MTGVGRTRWTAALAVISFTACQSSSVVTPSTLTPAPTPPQASVSEKPAAEIPAPRTDPPGRPPREPAVARALDAIFDSPAASNPVLLVQIEEWLEEWGAISNQRWLEDDLGRMAAYQGWVDTLLEREGLPSSLRYLPIIESGYDPVAVSRASAVGLWQLMTLTARGLGLEVTPLVDERRDPIESTRAAIRFLQELHARFDSWFLALAAYNGGPSRLDRLLQRHASDVALSDSLYFVVQPYLPAETRVFVAKLFAGAQAAMEPNRFRLDSAVEKQVYEFDEVTVPDATSMDVVAKAAGVDEREVLALNPHIVRRVTPRGREFVLRVPAGSAERFRSAYALVPADERITVTDHVVARGETLWGISRQYGVSLSALEAANPRVEARRLRPGHLLLVPIFPSAVGQGRASEASEPAATVHVVRRGETLWELARRYHLQVEDLRRWNDLEGDLLRPGQRLRLGAR